MSIEDVQEATLQDTHLQVLSVYIVVGGHIPKQKLHKTKALLVIQRWVGCYWLFGDEE